MFAIEEVVKVQWAQKTRGRPRVVSLTLRDGRGVSSQVDDELQALIEAWHRAGNLIEPPPPKRGPADPTTAWMNHPLFSMPSNEDATLWRYMNFDQFVALLQTASLWFSRGYVLRQLEPYEGRMPSSMIGMPDHQIVSKMFPGLNLSETEATNFADTYKKIRANLIANVTINCWHVGPYESNAMWRVYGKSDNSIAICTTLSRLRASFGAYRGYDVFIGEVTYIDYETHGEISPDNYLRPWLHKAKFFESEQEVRCMILDDGDAVLFGEEEPYISPGIDDSIRTDLSPGVGVPVDLDTLIPTIYISPNADPWFASVVATMVASFGLSAKTIPSSISIAPPG